MDLDALPDQVSRAVKHFWASRAGQATSHASGEASERGQRGAVLGGKQLDGFAELIEAQLRHSGVPQSSIFAAKRTELPGYFRATKKWDIVVVHDGMLLSAIELKSQVGSFGNNLNNRTEESLGNSTDINTAFREGAFGGSPAPWLGYLMLVEDAPKSTSPVKVNEPHFSTFPCFPESSYLDRYGILMTRLIRERLYSGATLLTSRQEDAISGSYREPNDEVSAERFVRSMCGHVEAYIA